MELHAGARSGLWAADPGKWGVLPAVYVHVSALWHRASLWKYADADFLRGSAGKK